ncbi:MAG TPA: hypothetical protein VLV76_25755, partial [Candidatus Acidoferrum sp.]|nr:hypothetical protein [Candidatus Acidoferrum sp.]
HEVEQLHRLCGLRWGHRSHRPTLARSWPIIAFQGGRIKGRGFARHPEIGYARARAIALLAAPLFGFAADPARREDRLPLGLFGGLSARPL